jgi:hypothetical protein
MVDGSMTTVIVLGIVPWAMTTVIVGGSAPRRERH